MSHGRRLLLRWGLQRREHLHIALAVVRPCGCYTTKSAQAVSENIRKSRTNLGSVSDFVVSERVEVLFDMHRHAFLGETRAEEGVRRAL